VTDNNDNDCAHPGPEPLFCFPDQKLETSGNKAKNTEVIKL
jgi:hypothetical protein